MSRWRLREGVLAQLDLPEAILLDSASGEYFDLNASGTVMLRALLGGGGTEAAVAATVARFAVDVAQAHADCAALLQTLQQRRLLVADPT